LLWAGHGPLFAVGENLVGGWFGNGFLVADGRLVSVVAGLASLLMCWSIGRKLWNEQAGLSAATLYLLCPFALVYNRMALTESIQSLYMLAALYLALLLADSNKKQLIGLGLALSLVLGGALLIKLNSVAVLAWCLLALALRGEFGRGMRLEWSKWLTLALASIGSLLIFAIQLLGPKYSDATGLENSQFPLQEVILAPGKTWWPRLFSFVGPTLRDYLTWPIVALIAISLLLTLWLLLKGQERQKYAARMACIPLGASLLGLMLPVFYISSELPRYLMTGVIPLVLPAGWVISLVASWLLLKWQSKSKPQPGRLVLVSTLLAALVSLAALPFFSNLLTEPTKAAFPKNDRLQFITGWPAGYGLKELGEVARQQATSTTGPVQLILVGTQYDVAGELAYYLNLFPSPQGLRTPANLTVADINIEAAADVFSRSIFQYAQPRPEQLVIAALTEKVGQPERWLKYNPDFEFLSRYDGPNGSYRMYRRKPAQPVELDLKTKTGIADLTCQLQLAYDSAKTEMVKYEVTIKNRLAGEASNFALVLPVDPKLGLSFSYFESTNNRVFLRYSNDSSTALGLSALEPKEVVTATLFFKRNQSTNALTPALAAPPTRYWVRWDDAAANDHLQYSNGVNLNLKPGDNTLKEGGLLQILNPPSLTETVGSRLSYTANFFAPDELVTYWVTGPGGTSKELGRVRANDKGEIKLALDTAELPPGNYSLAAYGNRSEVTANSLLKLLGR